MRCARFESGKKSHLNAMRGVENAAMTSSGKMTKRSDNSSPRRGCQEQSAPGQHSTPVARKQGANADAEKSPEPDYFPSPILPSYTQEGGNEVAWDWQSSSLSRTPESRSKKPSVQGETPKGTKLLQRKRNSNSPLLYKPLKRKTIKRENIENIGQFAAELQALSERMRVIKQSDKNPSSDAPCVKEEEMPMLPNTSGMTETSVVKNDGQNSVGRCNDNDNELNNVEETEDRGDTGSKEAAGSYDDLFDDSVDDDMIRCTQEIEEKFSLLERGNSAQLQVKKEESCSANDVAVKASVQFSSRETSRQPLVRNTLGAGDSSTLKTYSKLRRDADSSVHAAAQRSKDPPKPCPNNNNTIRPVHAAKPCDSKKLPKSNTVDLFDFADDSFDDWLATCVEDEKKLLPDDVSLSRKNDGARLQGNYRRLTNAALKSEIKSADSLKPMARASGPETSNNVNYLENRKFFKTKSLSDQYVSRDASAKGSTMSVSCRSYATRPALPHPSVSRGSIAHTSGTRAPVSTTTATTTPIVTSNGHKPENNAISLMRGTDCTWRGSDAVNRCAVKSDGDRFVKHRSTGSMKSDTRETARTGSQPTTAPRTCTAEEIERKRLQAVARLEAKRKLHFTKTTNSINR
ncbi:PREDICTED: uncharacterized protein LOC105455311 isoform X1 [Wasmannia auropunctata]|uniref:uncharacterized protein LOC105455311 isoform X1 n=1 Tax=Wasmannia auropunctata TaxID=64793 RepID=UPI0005F085A3|nr:PREDICTED: uncharacterized protein LOC105455311 isoform X1 [Wasmannia auropunctata]